MFTVPPGGEGLYYFSTYFLAQSGEVAAFNMVVNDVIVCTAYGDEDTNSGTDSPQATCSAVVDVVEGKFILTPLSRNEIVQPCFDLISVGWSNRSNNSHLQLVSKITTLCCSE